MGKSFVEPPATQVALRPVPEIWLNPEDLAESRARKIRGTPYVPSCRGVVVSSQCEAFFHPDSLSHVLSEHIVGRGLFR
jgi:hypothetical protein